VIDLVRNGIRAQGGFDFEMSYSAFDVFLAAVLFSVDFPAAAIVVDINGNNAITIVAATGNISDDAAGGLFAALNPGDILDLRNFINPLNNVLVRVLSKPDSNNIIVAGAVPLADETRAASAAGLNAEIRRGAAITNGVVQRSFTFEKEFSDLPAERFAVFNGMTPESLQLSLAADAIMTGSFGFLGKDEAPLAAATVGDGTNTPQPSGNVMNAIDNVLAIIEGGLAVNTDNKFCATALSISVANNLRERACIGELGANSIGAGKIEVTGTLQAFFEAQAAANKYLNFTPTSLCFVVSDDKGNRYWIELPRIKFSQGPKVAGGENTDVLLDLNFTAYRHETEGVTIRIARFPAA